MGKQITYLSTYIADIEKRARRIAYLIKSHQFESKFKDATIETQVKIQQLIVDLKIEALLEWMKTADTDDLDSMTVKQLRALARSMYVRDWNYLNKGTLIRSIIDERAAQRLCRDAEYNEAEFDRMQNP